MIRNLLSGVFAAVLVAQQQVSAQTPDSKEAPPLPSPPIIARAPALASWQIVYSYDSGAPKPDQNAKRTKDQPVVTHLANVQRIVVTKSTRTYHQEISYDDGKSMDVWWVNGMQVTRIQGQAADFVSAGPGSDDLYMDFAKCDFPDLDWVAPANYIGIDAINGVRCFSFRKQISLVPDNILQHLPAAQEILTEATVWISVSSRLPVQYSFKGQKENYVFGAPPSVPLSVPDEVAQKVAAWEIKKAQILRPAPLP